jgi:hypothetical protein
VENQAKNHEKTMMIPGFLATFLTIWRLFLPFFTVDLEWITVGMRGYRKMVFTIPPPFPHHSPPGPHQAPTILHSSTT